MQPENQFHQRLDALRQSPQTESGVDDNPRIQSNPPEAGPTFDMEETADIILPIDHPIFRRRHGSR